MPDLATDVELRALDTLIPYSNNPKEHPDEQIKKIASSIKNYGWDQPIVVDADGEIIKGHGRMQAAELLGLDEVPVIERADLSDSEAKAARIADNKTAETGWNDDLLAVELEQVSDDFDADALGFENDELDALLDDIDNDTPELEADPLADKDLADWDILNLYAGIGGNRKLWGDEPNVTAVEWDDDTAEVYREHFPNDDVVIGDAHEYLEENYDGFDFVWASPPCPTHSKLRQNVNPDTEPVYPDMKLYQEVIFLQHNFDGKWVVENVEPYYEPLIDAVKRGRHLFWANFDIPDVDITVENVKRQDGSYEELEAKYDMDLSNTDFDRRRKRKLLNNCVHPKLGKHILESALNDAEQTKLVTVES